jgi:hypothetical protein
MRAHKIYWRPELQSFLPPLNEYMLNALITEEINCLITAKKEGRIASEEEYKKRTGLMPVFGYPETPLDTDTVPLLTYSQFYMSLLQKLRTELGVWVEMILNYFKVIMVESDTAGDTVFALVDEISQVHRNTDKFLVFMHEHYPFELRSSSKDARLALEIRIKAIYANEVKKYFPEYRDSVSHNDVLVYLESLGCIWEVDEFNQIFRMHHGNDAVNLGGVFYSFIEELSELSAKKMFGKIKP